ncbi:MAG: NAD-dependent epimerase/dehydratase family protein [Lunatimonas sp.]|uniref:NAD-dependent epimerase/dehydratase family protein n=1 Tax=Lunatimonas sp. TaxID=2060141 RepID=UPI00263B9468|nr:NAD-dependent epimerase/dehydratase family protein [Lunatimonas sp.]MCC5936017.1 NAD-dependent epimerase/dehydratase family protein [Lunatimonas sp.]
MTKILITGAGGQLGSELTETLVNRYGTESVVATDINEESRSLFSEIAFDTLDVTDHRALKVLTEKHQITQIYHLAAILSATGEKKPRLAWQVNMDSLLSILELAKEKKLDKVYWPSSIAVFGPNSPRTHTPQHCIQEPLTVYGISKQAGERWCNYYFQKHGVDVRSLRYPGLVGYKSLPGGGTTDYAVDIYHHAVRKTPFTCFLKKDTVLPMMYMPDAIRATVELMEAPREAVKIRSSYNISSLSFTPEEIFRSILVHYPQFEISYSPDFRQEIADGWPQSIDDSEAIGDWGWKPEYDLERMTQDMLANLPHLY